MAETRVPLVGIVDSSRGSYLEDPRLEQEILGQVATAVLLRVDSPQALIGRIEDLSVVISWHTIPLPREILARMRDCRGIVRAAVGYDNIDVEFAAQRGIPVCIVPDYGTEEVADHTLGLLLALARNFRDLDRHARQGGWDWRTIGSVPRLRGLPLGIVGFGRIGSAVARRAQAFGLDVGFHDPYVPSGTEKIHGVHRAETLEALLDRSRMVSLHVPLNGETRGLIGRAELERLAPNGILVNTSRGEVIDEPALIEALQRNRLARVGLDVLSGEPHVPEALRASERVVLTAHSAFYADASLEELRRKAALSARKLVLGEPVRDVVNRANRAETPIPQGP